MRAYMLRALASSVMPRACFLADDVAITHYLTRAPNRFDVRRLRLRTKYRFDDVFAWSNSSINTYHRERAFKVNKHCLERLKAQAGGSADA